MNRSSALALSLLCGACVAVKSSSVSNRDLSARLEAKATGSGDTEITSYLHDGGIDSLVYVKLDPAETLTVTANATSRQLSSDTLLGVVTYSTKFTGADTLGTTYTWDLKRTSPPTLTSSCALPEKFTLSAPTNLVTSSRSTQDVTVTYNAGSAGVLRYKLEGTCIDDTELETVTDTGTFTIARAKIKARSGKEAETCAVKVILQRVASGTLDSNFGRGGKIECIQERTTTFNSAP